MKRLITAFVAICILSTCINLVIKAEYIDNFGSANDNLDEDYFITSN